MSVLTWSSTPTWISHAGPRSAWSCESGSKCYRTAWFWPDWYHNQSIWAHEMGHAFGLQHSACWQRQRLRQHVGRDERRWPVPNRAGLRTHRPAPQRLSERRPGLDPGRAHLRGSAEQPGDDHVWSRWQRQSQATSYWRRFRSASRLGRKSARVNGRAGELAGATTLSRRGGGRGTTPACQVMRIIFHEVNLDGDPQVRLVSIGASWLGGRPDDRRRRPDGCPASSSAMRRMALRCRSTRHADRLCGHHLHWAAARYTPRIRERGNDSRGPRRCAPRCTARQRPGPTDHAGSQERRLRDLDGESDRGG